MAKQHYVNNPTDKEKKAFAKYMAEDEELILATGLGKAYLRSRFVIGLMVPGGVFILGGLGLAWLMHFNLGIGLLLGLIVATIVALFKAYLTYHSNRYLLTTRRVIIKKGLVAVQLTTALYDKITHIEVEQHLFDKIFMHHGTIIVNTAGTNKGEISLKFIDYPIEFKNLLERMINREREEYGGRGSITTIEGELVEES